MNKKSEYHLIIIPVLMFFLILLSFHTSASAQGKLPPGSYKKSCKDIQLVAGNVLWAMCEKGDGKFQKSTLRLFDCEGDISNNNGVLTCKKKPGKRPPKGSYQNSCKDIQVEGKQLRAKCQKRNGSWNKTKINYKKCSGDIRNDNGELSCKGGGGSKIPKGSYRETCRDSYVEGNRLYSQCKKQNGSWNKTSINYKNCNRDIRNDNGKLSCERNNQSSFPKGSYKKSCKNLYMEGNVLEADCKNDNGKWKHSSIKYKNCNKSIWNDNGKLRCNK